MKAWVLYGPGDFRYEERGVPEPGPKEVLLKVKCAGICGSDPGRIYKDGAHVHPLIPGHEFSGVVEKTGSGAERGLLGKRAGVFPLIPCKKCEPCLSGHFELCRSYSYLGSRCDGGFAEYAVVPADNLILLPKEVTDEEAAMLEPLAVAVHAARLFPSGPGANIFVQGLGTIGLFTALIFIGEGLSDRLFVLGNKDFQKRVLLGSGLPEGHFCDIRKEDPLKWTGEMTGGKGADLIFECVGSLEAASAVISLAGPGGRVVLVGNPRSDMSFEKNIYWKILRNQLTIKGTWNSSFSMKKDGRMDDGREDDWSYALKRLKKGNIKPESIISHRFKFDELEKGLAIMWDKTEDYGKILIFN